MSAHRFVKQQIFEISSLSWETKRLVDELTCLVSGILVFVRVLELTPAALLAALS